MEPPFFVRVDAFECYTMLYLELEIFYLTDV